MLELVWLSSTWYGLLVCSSTYIYPLLYECVYIYWLSSSVLVHIVNSFSPIVDVLLLYILTIALFSLIGEYTHTHKYTHYISTSTCCASNDIEHTPSHHTRNCYCMSYQHSLMDIHAPYAMCGTHTITILFDRILSLRSRQQHCEWPPQFIWSIFSILREYSNWIRIFDNSKIGHYKQYSNWTYVVRVTTWMRTCPFWNLTPLFIFFVCIGSLIPSPDFLDSDSYLQGDS